MIPTRCLPRQLYSLLLTVTLGSLALLTTPAYPLQDAALPERVNELFAQWNRPDSPGCALAVIRDGKIVYSRGYGIANLDHNSPITPKTVFNIASTSKQFVAASAALLAQQGKLSLDDDVRKYLPEIPIYGSTITIRHLILHTSGIRDYVSLMFLAGLRIDSAYTDKDIVELIARQRELNFRPGDRYQYSNSGYVLLAVIVERVSGKSLRQFAAENIFKPLGMTDTVFYDDRTMIVKNRAAGYSQRQGTFAVRMSNWDRVGDGGLLTTVEDLFLWDQNFYNANVGGKELIAQLTTPGKLNNGESIDYGFGLGVDQYKGLKRISHSGGIEGFVAQTVRFPEQKFSIVCLCNLDGINPTALTNRLADIYLADQFKSEVTKVSKTGARFIELSKEELTSKAGAYRNSSNGNILTLSVREGKLVVNRGSGAFSVAPLSPTRFRSVDAPANTELEFHRQSPHHPWSMNIIIEGQKAIAFESIKLVTPNAERLAEYVGDYYSNELQITYKISLQAGRLVVKHKFALNAEMSPLTEDEFSAAGFRFNIKRDEQGHITGFSANARSAQHIWFEKTTLAHTRVQ